MDAKPRLPHPESNLLHGDDEQRIIGIAITANGIWTNETRSPENWKLVCEDYLCWDDPIVRYYESMVAGWERQPFVRHIIEKHGGTTTVMYPWTLAYVHP